QALTLLSLIRPLTTEIYTLSLHDALPIYLRKKKKARVIYESAQMTVAENFRVGQAAGRAVRWHGREGLVEELRAVKDSEEIAAMRQAARLGCEVFQEILTLVKPGVRGVELAAEIEYRMRRKGASGAAFDTIDRKSTRLN